MKNVLYPRDQVFSFYQAPELKSAYMCRSLLILEMLDTYICIATHSCGKVIAKPSVIYHCNIHLVSSIYKLLSNGLAEFILYNF